MNTTELNVLQCIVCGFVYDESAGQAAPCATGEGARTIP